MTDVIRPRVRAVENMVRRARAKTSRRPSPPACSTCRISLWVSFFFDGTNNHRDRDFPVRHSNVVGLFDSHVREDGSGVFAFYYEGCGTEFRFDDYFELSDDSRTGMPIEKEGYVERESTVNQGLGRNIDKRLEKAIFEFQDFIETTRLSSRVDEINIAAFGFSRGATTARAFAHWLNAHSKVTRNGSQLRYDGITLNFKFMGLFDTVESIGLGSQNRQARLIKTSIPNFVQRVFHVVAAHELRPSFALTGLGGDSRNWKTVVYPGAHANIGGGYSANEQMRENAISRIASLQMLDEARATGLKMLSLNEMKASSDEGWSRLYRPSFDVPAESKRIFDDYLGHISPSSGPIREVFTAHMRWFWQWIDTGLAAEDSGEKFRRVRQDNSPDSAERRRELTRHSSLLSYRARTQQGRGYGALNGTPTHPVTERSLPEPVEYVLENYVHDSQLHFILAGARMKDMSLVDYYRVRQILAPRA